MINDSFKSFFLQEEKQNRYKHLLVEMPTLVKGGEIGYISSEREHQTNIKYIKDTGGRHIDDVTIDNVLFEVWRTQDNYDEVCLVFINDSHIHARIEFSILTEKDIKMSFIWQWKYSRGLMQKIYVQYLLNHFQTITSDKELTLKAFSFYEKLCMASGETYSFSIYDEKQNMVITTIHDCNELQKYFGEQEEYSNYRFKLTKT